MQANFGLLLWNCNLGVLSMIYHCICKVLKHRKLKTCLHIKIASICLGLVIVSLVPHWPYNPSPRHIKSKLMCRHVNSYKLQIDVKLQCRNVLIPLILCILTSLLLNFTPINSYEFMRLWFPFFRGIFFLSDYNFLTKHLRETCINY